MIDKDFIFEKVSKFIEDVDFSNLFAEYYIKKLLDIIPKLYNKISIENVLESDEKINSYINNAFQNQIIELINFSSSFQIYGLSEKKKIKNYSIKLSISDSIKQFKGSKNTVGNYLTETNLLFDDIDYLILGDPGAGKTTILKRLIDILSRDTSKSNLFSDRIPILIKLSEIKENKNLFTKIAEIIGVHFTQIKVENQHAGESEYYENKIGDKKLEDFIVEIINDIPFLFLIDGLDEVKYSISEVILNNIQGLVNRKTNTSKIILTNRSGNFKTIQGLNVCEIKDLDDSQILELTSKWYGSKEKAQLFLNELNETNYKTTARKPLFLANLMMIYDEEGNLPVKSIEVYNRLIQLLIWQWDRDRLNINRVSIFGNRFDNFKKYDFLKELSYNLLYRKKAIEFSNSDLKSVYQKIYRKYDLKENAEEIVIQEIESHNGLVIKIGFDKYKFFHLTIQEYLCAEYLIRLPKAKEKFHSYILDYPEPIGVAAALSNDASDWLAYLIFMYDSQEIWDLHHSFAKIIYRASIENADFEYSLRFGFALLFLLNLKPDKEIQKQYLDFIRRHRDVKSSLENALILYKKTKTQSEGNLFVTLEFDGQAALSIEKYIYYRILTLPLAIYNEFNTY